MNYLAHGYRYLDDPCFLAGTAVPDWLSAADRPVRVRAKQAAQFTADDDPRAAALARGIMQHHADDAWFHETAAFVALSARFSVMIREALPAGHDHRPGFVGHILVELLMDAALIEDRPNLVDDYYQALNAVDPAWIEAQINRMSPRPTQRLAWLVRLFRREQFLRDYVHDADLFERINHVMFRVGLPVLPLSVQSVLPIARREVYGRVEELLPQST